MQKDSRKMQNLEIGFWIFHVIQFECGQWALCALLVLALSVLLLSGSGQVYWLSVYFYSESGLQITDTQYTLCCVTSGLSQGCMPGIESRIQ